MKKIFQTIVDKNHGNCMQAVVASLFDLELNQVPNFIESDSWFIDMMNFFKKQGYSDICPIYKNRHDDKLFLKKVAKFDKGVNGYFYASVPSQTYEDITHAVVVDENLNIIHDPNPNQMALKLNPEDIISIIVVHDMIIGKTGKLFSKEEWNNTTEEERDLNTYKIKK